MLVTGRRGALVDLLLDEVEGQNKVQRREEHDRETDPDPQRLGSPQNSGSTPNSDVMRPTRYSSMIPKVALRAQSRSLGHLYDP